MTESAPPLPETDCILLSFLAEEDRFLYNLLDNGYIPNYSQATQSLSGYLLRGWITTGWREGAIVYRLTELGRECLRSGLHLEAMPQPAPKPFWRQ